MKPVQRMVHRIGLLMSVTAAPAALAALPLEFERAEELSAAAKAAARHLIPDLIDRIEYTAKDKITVWAGKCFVLVDIVDTPRESSGWVGARMFEARAKPRMCN